MLPGGRSAVCLPMNPTWANSTTKSHRWAYC